MAEQDPSTGQRYEIDGKLVSRYEHQLLDCAQEIHSCCTGASDCASNEELEAMCGFLEARLGDWQLATVMTAGFDGAVQRLCKVAVSEWRNEAGRRSLRAEQAKRRKKSSE